jgi:hypothetical protein
MGIGGEDGLDGSEGVDGSEGSEGSDDLSMYAANLPGDYSDEEIREILEKYPAEGLSYDEWLRVGMALHHQYSGSAEGYGLWVSWSALSSKHDGRYMRAKWRSFHQHKTPVTVDGLVGVVRRIESLRRREQMDENRRVGEGETDTPFADVLDLDEFLERFVYVGEGCGVFDVDYPHHFLTLAEHARYFSSSQVAGRKGRMTPVTGLWVKDPSRVSVMTRTFRAGAGVFTVDPGNKLSVNLWRRFVRDEEEINEAFVEIFVEQVRFIFGNEAERFLDWLAHIEQSPGELPHTAWLSIATNTGLGRNWISSVLARVWAGQVAASFDLLGMFDSGFNGALSGKILTVVDEIKVGGGDWAHSEELKSIITQEMRIINPKYGRQYTEFNSCRWLVFSNHITAIPLDDEDRRWEVVINDSKPRSASYYKKLYGALNQEGFIESIAKYLLKRDISGFNPGAHAVSTAGKMEVQEASKSNVRLACDHVIEQWPTAVIAASDLMEVMRQMGVSFASHKAVPSAMMSAGARLADKKIWAYGKSQRAYILRDREKILGLKSKELADIAEKGKTEYIWNSNENNDLED